MKPVDKIAVKETAVNTAVVSQDPSVDPQTNTLRFMVYGIPKSQGSKIAFAIRAKDAAGRWYYTGRAALVESGNRLARTELKDWRDRITATARAAAATAQWPVADEPVSLHLLFVIPKPKEPQFDVPAVKPDLSKLIRAVEDALQDAALYTNDSRIVELHARKAFEDVAGCGVVITLTKGVK